MKIKHYISLAIGWLFVFLFYYICYLLFAKDFDFIIKLNPWEREYPSGSIFFDLFPWLLANLIVFSLFAFIAFAIWRIIILPIILHFKNKK